ncbi:snare protein syntaxin 18/UFE1 [Peniophora sp. CONT]|nr:snare protein syntaxin 18/UFE1 [Peniophora sp. CONT]
MAIHDSSQEFRLLVEEKRKELPPNKRRKLSRPSHRIPGEAQRDGATPFMQEYMREAHTILNHISTLGRMLSNIRKPYLDVHARQPPLARQARVLDPSDEKAWTDVKYLSNEERDQIDMQARIVLSKCADRVKQMEALEKRRSEVVAQEANPLMRLLPARLKVDSSSAVSDFVAAHNAGVTWFLTRRLAETSQNLREMQEERVRRQTERTRTLGSGAGREAAYMSIGEPSSVSDPASPSGGWLGNASSLASSWITGTPSSVPSSLPPEAFDLSSDEDEDDVELSASQIQQFESENAAILRTVEDTLAAVQQAEARLLEIGELQVELVNQLTRQTELTDQLYDDAVASAEYVERGNVQLREARRRAADSRKWILLFLIGASLSLLFLHYY